MEDKLIGYQSWLGNWQVDQFIGAGSYGKVYRLKREEFGETYLSALKLITIPQDAAEVRQMEYDGMDDASISSYFESMVKDISREIRLMNRLKGHSNIVSYEDHLIQRQDDGCTWDILIRMEYLTSINEHFKTFPPTRADIIHLGIDICQALELCQKYNIIHRDIKPDNIFISPNGDYKLGDFGIARQMERTMGNLSKKGTFNYMAPEVYKGSDYNSSVDIYSLGIVMYRLLNGNRLPFLPDAPLPILPDDRERSMIKRMSGEPLPLPRDAKNRLGEIVLKACAFDLAMRYSSPSQMMNELKVILYEEADSPLVYPQGDAMQLATDSGSSFSNAESASKKKQESPQEDASDKTVSLFSAQKTATQSGFELNKVIPSITEEIGFLVTPPSEQADVGNETIGMFNVPLRPENLFGDLEPASTNDDVKRANASGYSGDLILESPEKPVESPKPDVTPALPHEPEGTQESASRLKTFPASQEEPYESPESGGESGDSSGFKEESGNQAKGSKRTAWFFVVLVVLLLIVIGILFLIAATHNASLGGMVPTQTATHTAPPPSTAATPAATQTSGLAVSTVPTADSQTPPSNPTETGTPAPSPTIKPPAKPTPKPTVKSTPKPTHSHTAKPKPKPTEAPTTAPLPTEQKPTTAPLPG